MQYQPVHDQGFTAQKRQQEDVYNPYNNGQGVNVVAQNGGNRGTAAAIAQKNQQLNIKRGSEFKKSA